jgi:photosystem II stability/assembly factor-like uncharacterized protein
MQKDSDTPADKFIDKHAPADHFMSQKFYPDGLPKQDDFLRIIDTEIKRSKENRSTGAFEYEWTFQGPGNLGARINTVAVHPEDNQIILAGFSGGGIYRTENGGNTWDPVFDDNPFLAIADLVFDLNDPSIVYAGTGDVNISGYPFLGNGIFKSTDTGRSWTQMGLSEGGIISKIHISPSNSDVIYASVMGSPFIPGIKRGLFKSTDGGTSWNHIFFINDQTGVVDFIIDPDDEDNILASTWERIRTNTVSTVASDKNRLYRTTDGGAFWEESLGMPQGFVSGRIGLHRHENTGRVYTVVVDSDSRLGSIHSSDDFGTTWDDFNISEQTGLSNYPLGGFGWYFGGIYANPDDEEEVYLLGVDLWVTFDKGETWELGTSPWWSYDVHADKHDMTADKEGNFYLATDGGLYKLPHGSLEWQDIEDIPTTQFYRVASNPAKPHLYYGGAQDNGTTGGNKDIINDFPRIYGADGFLPSFVENDSTIMFVETQYGGLKISTDGGDIFQNATQGIDNNDRKNWDLPYLVSHFENGGVYYGTHRLYKSDSIKDPSFSPMSDDLTDGLIFDEWVHTISCIGESYYHPGYIYVGTTDGNVWLTVDDGDSWDPINSGLPDRYITSVHTSPNVEGSVYVTLSGYKNGELTPHVFHSDNLGLQWSSIHGNLPNVAINDLFVYPGKKDSVVFVATDIGVFGTIDSGDNWEPVGTNMPSIMFMDLAYNEGRNELVAGTFAKGIVTFPLDSIFFGVPTSVDNTPIELPFTIGPNPAVNQLNIAFDTKSEKCNYFIYDMTGKQIVSGSLYSGYESISISNLVNGTYFLRIIDEEGNTGTSKFIKL